LSATFFKPVPWLLGAGGLVLAGAWFAGGAGSRSLARQARDRQDDLVEARAATEVLRLELDAGREREATLRKRIAQLQTELGAVTTREAARHQEWLEFTRALSSLPVPEGTDMPRKPAFVVEPAQPVLSARDAAQASIEAEADGRAERARQHLNALLIAEHIFSLNVLELGRVHEGWAGPVVVRLLDDRGRLTGTLAADRLRLEASRAGRSMALVLEIGWESRAGLRVPFGPPEQAGSDRGGLRRIHFPGVDPGPWIEFLPELLNSEDLAPTPDDGRWNLIELRLTLDERLRNDSPEGRWRAVRVGGVRGGTMFDVHLADVDRRGRVVRRLFADSMAVRTRGRGLELVLEDGVVERDGAKAPFLDGRFRLFLPDARSEVWKAAGVPGLSLAPSKGTDRGR
jgi:hypothetical protein